MLPARPATAPTETPARRVAELTRNAPHAKRAIEFYITTLCCIHSDAI